MSEVLIRLARGDDALQVGPLHVQVWNDAYAGLIEAEVLAERAAQPMEDRVEMWRRRLLAYPTYVAVASEGCVAVASEGCVAVASEGCVAVASEGCIVGFAIAGPARDSDMTVIELMSLYVTSEIYGTGVGHRLLLRAIGERPAYLWVLNGNERAIRFYEGHGFRFDGVTRYDPPYGTESRMVRPL